jgi:RHS repeat-associated protein
MRTSSGACSSAPCYLLADHLGSTVGMTDHNGAVLSTQKYWPYGAMRSGSLSQTDKLYTGQQQEPGDTSLGLYNYKARFYSTTLGTFASADTSTSDGYNRFGYARGNPATFNDPTGHGVTIEDHTFCPSTRPNCLNDGGPGPIGGPGPDPDPDPCDAHCHLLRGIDAYCHSAAGAGDRRCGGVGVLHVPPTRTSSNGGDVDISAFGRSRCPGAESSVSCRPIGSCADVASSPEECQSSKASGDGVVDYFRRKLRDRDCAGLAVDSVGVVSDAYGQTLFAGNVSGVVGIIGGRAAFAIGLSIDTSQRDWKGMGLDLAGVFGGWIPGGGEAIGSLQIAYASASCVK